MPNDLSGFLSSLTEAQMHALHIELEALDRAAADIVEDVTPHARDLLEQCWKQKAAETDDPEAYMMSVRAHHTAFQRHYPKWSGGTVKELLMHAMPGSPEWTEAKRLAELEAPDPSKVADEPRVEAEVAEALQRRKPAG